MQTVSLVNLLQGANYANPKQVANNVQSLMLITSEVATLKLETLSVGIIT